MRRILAALWFSIKSAGQNFRRNLGVSLAGVFTMGLILFLVGGALLFTHSVNSILQAQQANASKIKIYLSDSASLPAIADFQTRLQHDPRVISVSFESKDQAAKEASQDPDIQQALSTLGSNPLPASLNLDVRQLTDQRRRDGDQIRPLRGRPGTPHRRPVAEQRDVGQPLRGFYARRCGSVNVALALAQKATTAIRKHRSNFGCD